MYNRTKGGKVMLILNRIENETHFSDGEQVVADYVLSHAREVVKMTIHELAAAAYTSAATITRFCHRLNMDGFADFKVLLASDLASFNISKDRIATDLPFGAGSSAASIMDSILNLNYQSMQDTFNHLDQDQIERVALRISQSPHIYLYGTGQSLIQALEFQYKLYRIGIDTQLEMNTGFQLMKTATQPEDSLTILISYYGSGSDNLRIAEHLHARGLKYILITGPNENPLCKFADEVIHVPPQEELVTKMASYSSRTAIQLVLDLLYAMIFSFDYEKNTGVVEKTTFVR